MNNVEFKEEEPASRQAQQDEYVSQTDQQGPYQLRETKDQLIEELNIIIEAHDEFSRIPQSFMNVEFIQKCHIFVDPGINDFVVFFWEICVKFPKKDIDLVVEIFRKKGKPLTWIKEMFSKDHHQYISPDDSRNQYDYKLIKNNIANGDNLFLNVQNSCASYLEDIVGLINGKQLKLLIVRIIDSESKIDKLINTLKVIQQATRAKIYYVTYGDSTMHDLDKFDEPE